MDLNLIHFYPNLMNLYGSYANLSILKSTLERLGHRVELQFINPYEPCSPDCLFTADFIFMGAGTENSMQAALSDMQLYRNALQKAIDDGIPMLFCGTAMELLGASVTDRSNKTVNGLGLANYITKQSDKRYVEDVIGYSDFLEQPVVGFMNKSSLTENSDSPFITKMTFGIGNTGAKTPEGYLKNNLIATSITGPILVKNPHLLRWYIAKILQRRGTEPPAVFPDEPFAESGYAVTVKELTARSEKAK